MSDTEDPRAGSDDKPWELTRLSVNLTPRSLTALTSAAAANQDSRTDTVNRALQLYDFVTRETAAGGTLLMRRADGVLVEVQLL